MVQSERETIRGIVIPTDWNNKGFPREVAIATYLEEKYVVTGGLKVR